MPNKKINELSPRTPSLTDLIIVGDPATGYSYKATISVLTAFAGSNIQFSSLGGISLTNPANGQILQFDGTNWVNASISVPVTSVFGRTGNVVAAEGDYFLTQLGDVTLSTPSTNQVLQYNGSAWVNATLTDNGITSLNGLTAVSQTFATGTSGTDFAISSTTSTHTFNLPTASATNRGALSSADWSTFNAKQDAITLTTTGSSGSATLVGATLNIPTYTLAGLGGVSGSGTTNYLSKWTSSSALGNSLVFDNGTNVGIGTASPTSGKLQIDAGSTVPIAALTSNLDVAQYFASGSYAGFRIIANSNNVPYIGLNTSNSVNTYNVGTQRAFFAYWGDVQGYASLGYASSTHAIVFRTNNGNVILGGGTTDAGFKLDVSGTFRSTGDANINGLTVGKGGGSVATNTAVGSSALNANTTGVRNTAIGSGAGAVNTTSSDNTYIGNNAGQSATGQSNTAIGANSADRLTSGANNTFVGRTSGYATTTGGANVYVGMQAGYDGTTGGGNVAIGYNTGRGITTGNYNTIIGSEVTGLSSSLSNTIILADGQGNQRLYINNSGNVGIGTTSPTNTLQIQNANSTYSNPASTNVPSIYVNNTSNASTTAHSMLLLRTGGASGGNPFLVFDNNVLGYSMGIDNADNDLFKISSSWLGVSSGSLLLQLYPAGSSRPTGSLFVAGDLGGGGKLLPTFGNTGEYIFNSASNGYAISIFTGSTESMRVFNSTGNVLIQRGGTFTDAGYKLDVNGTARIGTSGRNTQMTNDAFGGTLTVNTDNASGYSILNVFNSTGVGFRVGASSTIVQFTVNTPYIFSGIFSGDMLNMDKYGKIIFNNTNYSGADFQIKGQTNSNLFYAKVSTDNIGIGTTTPNASALLDVSSTTKGFLPPRLSGTQAEAIATPAAGLMVYANNGNGTTITSTGWWGYDGTTWVKLN